MKILFSLFIPVLFLQSPINGETYDEYFMERVKEIESEKIEVKEKVETFKEKGDFLDYLKRAEDLLLEKGRENEVIMLSSKSLKIKESFLGFFFRAYSLAELNKHNDAITDLKAAIDINNQSPAAFNNLGVSLTETGDNYSAINYFEKALKIDPELAIAYHNIGISKYNIGSKKSACDDFKKAAYLGRKSTLEWIQSKDGSWCRNLR